MHDVGLVGMPYSEELLYCEKVVDGSHGASSVVMERRAVGLCEVAALLVGFEVVVGY